MKIRSKCKLIFAYTNAISLSCIFGVAFEYMSGNGFARNGFIIGVTLYILSKFTERLVEALLIESEEVEEWKKFYSEANE